MENVPGLEPGMHTVKLQVLAQARGGTVYVAALERRLTAITLEGVLPN